MCGRELDGVGSRGAAELDGVGSRGAGELDRVGAEARRRVRATIAPPQERRVGVLASLPTPSIPYSSRLPRFCRLFPDHFRS